ncbi:MAG: hypothetical protein NZM26_03680 [Patescibacteria group bacterium]|nr:hypothetical protein [Patescibacteria group bacterium]
MNDTNKNCKFHLKIQSRQGIIFEGDVESVTSYNAKGKFDVLSLHSNFISLIEKKIIVRNDNKIIQDLDIDIALLRVKENFAEVYLGIRGGLTETI